MRLIDADAFIEESRNRIDMQDVYLPIHIKELVIDQMPTIDAQPIRHGKWIYKVFEKSRVGFFECSECGYVTFNEKVCHYCYNCGAKMNEVEE